MAVGGMAGDYVLLLFSGEVEWRRLPIQDMMMINM